MDPRFGTRRGKSEPYDRMFMFVFHKLGLTDKQIRAILKDSLDIDMKESSIRTWTHYFYKIIRYKQNRERKKINGVA